MKNVLIYGLPGTVVILMVLTVFYFFSEIRKIQISTNEQLVVFKELEKLAWNEIQMLTASISSREKRAVRHLPTKKRRRTNRMLPHSPGIKPPEGLETSGIKVEVKASEGCPAGPAGPMGSPGMDGVPGLDGIPGKPGFGFGALYRSQPERACYQCPAGPAGDPGPDGSEGIQGPPGLPGLKGMDGSTGPEGHPGLQGEPGFDGNDGIDGEIGEKGKIMMQLVTVPGPKGPTGPKGLPGQPGMPGLSAIPEEGSPGIEGLPGLAGTAGTIGIPGLPGAAGQPGSDAQYCPCPDRTMEIRVPPTSVTASETSSEKSSYDYWQFQKKRKRKSANVKIYYRKRI